MSGRGIVILAVVIGGVFGLGYFLGANSKPVEKPAPAPVQPAFPEVESKSPESGASANSNGSTPVDDVADEGGTEKPEELTASGRKRKTAKRTNSEVVKKPTRRTRSR